MLRGRARAPVFGRPLHEFPGQPQLVKDILLRLKGSLCHKDLFLVVPSARTLEKISLMRKAWDAGTCPLRLAGVQDADAIAGALILWLECLPEPLWPQQLFYPLLQAVAEPGGDARRASLQLLLRQVVNHAPADALGARLAPLLLRPPPPPPPPAQALANSGRAAGAVTLLIRDYRSLFLTAAAPPLAPPRPEGAAAAALRPEGPRGSPGRAPIAGLAALMAGRLSAQLALRDSGGGSPRASECPVGAPRSAGPCDEGAWDEGACSGGQLARGPAPLATATDAGGTGAGGRGAGELTPRSRTRAEADEIWAAAAAAEAARSAGACGGCGGAGVTADPEADPDAAEAEAEIDSLLSGSLEAVLFEPDDAAFRAAINPNPNPARSATCSAEPGPGSPDSSAGSGSSWSGALCASFPPGASLLVSPRGVAPGSLEPAKGAAAAAAALCGLPSPPPSLTLRQGITAAMLVCGGVSGAPSADMAAAAAAAAAAQPAAWGLGSASPKRRLSDEAKALLGEKQTVALARALADADACNACPGKDPLRPLFVRYKRALRGQSKQG